MDYAPLVVLFSLATSNSFPNFIKITPITVSEMRNAIAAPRSVPIYGCRSSNKLAHVFKVHRLFLYPEVPTVPGKLEINLFAEVTNRQLPHRLDLESNVRLLIPYLLYQKIPCYNSSLTGCGGIGSCIYCDILGDCHPHKPARNLTGRVDSLCSLTAGYYRISIARDLPDISERLADKFALLPPKPVWEIGLRLRDRESLEEVGCGVSYIKTQILKN